MYSPSDPRTVNSGVEGAILSRKEKPMRRGESSMKAEPGLYTSPLAQRLRVGVSAAASLRANSLPVSERARAAPGAGFPERRKGPAAASAGRRPPSLEREEPALPRGGVCPVLTLAAEPGLVRGCRLRRPVVALLPLGPAARSHHRSRPARRPSAALTAAIGGCRCSAAPALGVQARWPQAA